MKHSFKDVASKSIKELTKDVASARAELAKAMLEKKVSTQKDTNIISKTKKRLAMMLTALQLKKEETIQK